LSFYSISQYGQYAADLSLLKLKLEGERSINKPYKELRKSHHNEVQFLMNHSFMLYKSLISSQDISSCNFSPSCSEYALQAVNKQGMITGLINFIDRFSRCNGLNSENYSFTGEKNLLYDPVRNVKGQLPGDEK